VGKESSPLLDQELLIGRAEKIGASLWGRTRPKHKNSENAPKVDEMSGSIKKVDGNDETTKTSSCFNGWKW